MGLQDQLPTASADYPAGRRSSVFLPKEHGSWSLALEPVALGLLAAPTPAGGALAVSAVAAFFLRRPLKSARGNRPSIVAAVVLGLAAAGGLTAALALGGWRPLLPLTPALPLAGLFLYWDRQNETRATQAELAASSIFALLPTAMALQAGWPFLAAAALTVIMLARSLPTVLIVRTYLRLRKNQAPSLVPAVSVMSGTVLVLVIMALRHLAPWTAAGLTAASMLRLGLLLPALRPDWPARRLGIGELVFGIIYVVTIAISLHLGDFPL